YGGQRASWEDLQRIFEGVSHQSLDWFFKQWLDLKGAPELKLEDVELKTLSVDDRNIGATGRSPLPTGYQVTGKVVQLGDIYQLRIPVQINFGSGRKIFDLDLTQRETPFSYTVQDPPFSLVLDPEYHLFRKIAPEAITPCLNALLKDKDKLFIYPTEGTPEEISTYRGLAEMAASRKGGKVLPDANLTEELLTGNSVLIFGNPRRSEVATFLNRLTNFPGSLELGENDFKLDGKEYKGEEHALLATWRNPQNPRKYLTFYFGLSPSALSRARYLFYYGWDSYLVFEKGRPVQRGDWPEMAVLSRPTQSEVEVGATGPVAPTAPAVEAFNEAALLDHIQYLASEELKGR
ncbi:MAG: hypothetical protein L0Y56_13965, partial [Nitrospira sp.]|nr:hypothetical protein [Nitrospira sp.]